MKKYTMKDLEALVDHINNAGGGFADQTVDRSLGLAKLLNSPVADKLREALQGKGRRAPFTDRNSKMYKAGQVGADMAMMSSVPAAKVATWAPKAAQAFGLLDKGGRLGSAARVGIGGAALGATQRANTGAERLRNIASGASMGAGLGLGKAIMGGLIPRLAGNATSMAGLEAANAMAGQITGEHLPYGSLAAAQLGARGLGALPASAGRLFIPPAMAGASMMTTDGSIDDRTPGVFTAPVDQNAEAVPANETLIPANSSMPNVEAAPGISTAPAPQEVAAPAAEGANGAPAAPAVDPSVDDLINQAPQNVRSEDQGSGVPQDQIAYVEQKFVDANGKVVKTMVPQRVKSEQQQFDEKEQQAREDLQMMSAFDGSDINWMRQDPYGQPPVDMERAMAAEQAAAAMDNGIYAPSPEAMYNEAARTGEPGAGVIYDAGVEDRRNGLPLEGAQASRLTYAETFPKQRPYTTAEILAGKLHPQIDPMKVEQNRIMWQASKSATRNLNKLEQDNAERAGLLQEQSLYEDRKRKAMRRKQQLSDAEARWLAALMK